MLYRLFESSSLLWASDSARASQRGGTGRVVWVSWRPPQSPFVKINVDGASKARLGYAGAGYVMRDQSGGWLAGGQGTLAYVRLYRPNFGLQ